MATIASYSLAAYTAISLWHPLDHSLAVCKGCLLCAGSVEETNDSSQNVLYVSGNDNQTVVENEPAMAMLGREISEATSEINAGREESMVLESVQEATVIEAQQESYQEESQTGSSQPSENVVPKTIPPSESNLVTGIVNVYKISQ